MASFNLGSGETDRVHIYADIGTFTSPVLGPDLTNLIRQTSDLSKDNGLVANITTQNIIP